MPGKQIDRWNESLGRLIELTGDDLFPSTLISALGDVVEFNDALVLAYRDDDIPVILFDRLHPTDRNIFYDSYFSGVYLASPFYQAFARGQASGVYRVTELAPNGFYQSEYYRRYYQHIGASDLVSYLIHANEGWAILVSLGRQKGARSFSKGDIEKLRKIEVVLGALCRRHWSNPWQAATATQSMHQQFQTRFDSFGAFILTQRELDVVKLLLLGHSSKSVADGLHIAHDTVRVHRKNIYQKLGVRSQGELFSLLIAELTGN